MLTKYYSIITEVLKKNISNLNMTEEKMQMTLSELGVDSLDIMLLLMDIQEQTGIRIPEDQVDNLNTPQKIAKFLASQE